MSRLSELRATRRAPRTTEKKSNSLECEPAKPTKGTFAGFVGSISREMEFFSAPPRDGHRVPLKKSNSLECEPAKPTKGTFAGFVGSIPREIEFFSAPPKPKDRLCYQCQHFNRSPFGRPLGLCAEHGNRIQHSTSEPSRFGCGSFETKEARA